MAFPSDLSDVATDDIITASRNNAITNKIGANGSGVITSLDYLLKSTSSTDPGHLHTKVGTIATGVWNGTAIANANLANSTVNYGNVTLALGGSDTTPAFNLSDAGSYPGDASLVTVGTITSGTWSGTAIADEKGGTGQTTYAAGDILYASGADTLAKLAKGSDTEVLTLASGLPEWAAGGGGAGPDFAEQVTITTDTDPALEVDQTGSGDILKLQDDGTDRFEFTSGGLLDITRLADNTNTQTALKITVGQGGHYAREALVLENSSATGNLGQVWSLIGVKYLGIEVNAPTFDSPIVNFRNLVGAIAATGNQELFRFEGTVNKSESGNYTGIKLNVTEAAAPGSGNILLDLQVGGNTVFNIDPDGIFAINTADDALTINQSGTGNALAIQNDGTEVFRFDQDTGDLIWHNAASECITFSQSGAGSYMIIKKAAASLMTLSPSVQFHGGITVPSGLGANTLQFGSQADCNGGLRLRGTGDNGWGDHVLFDQQYEETTVGASAYSDTTLTIPAGSILLAVTGRVNTQPTGTSTVDVGVDGAPDRFGTIPSTTLGTQFEFSGLFGMYTSATKIRFTPNTTPSTGHGRIRVSITYIELYAPSA